MLKKPLIAFALLIISLSLMTYQLTLAQETLPPPPATVEIGTIDDSEFPRLKLLVSVLDGSTNEPILGLTTEDFISFVDGEAMEIDSVENIQDRNLPISVVLVLDSSESMLGRPIQDARAAGLAFVDQLAPADEVAIVDFDSSVRVVQPFTSDFDAARTAIENIEAAGRTALYDAAAIGVQTALEANHPRRFVILLTDGNEFGNLSTNPAEAGGTLGKENNIAVYTIGIGYGVDPRFLGDLAEGTRGQFYQEPNSEQLTEIYSFLANYLRTQYIVTIDPVLEPDGAEHQVRVDVANGSNTVVYTAPDLYPQFAVTGLPEGPMSEVTQVQVVSTAERGVNEFDADVPEGMIFDSAANITADDNTVTFDFTIDPYLLPPGEHTITATVSDDAGGERDFPVTFEVAALPPIFEISGLPAEGEIVTTPALDVEITVSQQQAPFDSVTYSIDGTPVANPNEAPYAATLDILQAGAGAHTLTVDVVSGDVTTSASADFEVDAALFITPSPTPTNTPTPTPTPTATDTPEPTATNTPTATETPAPTDTPEPTNTEILPTDTPQPSDTPEATEEAALVITETPRPTNTTRPSNTPEPTATNTPLPTDTDTPEPTATNTPLPTDTPASTNTARPTSTPRPPSDTPAPTNTARPSATATEVAAAQTLEPTAPPAVEVDVEGEGEEQDLESYLPYIGIALLLLIILLGYLYSRRNREQTRRP